jgi:hypothetical protein
VTFFPLAAMRVVTSIWLTKTIPAPNRPRIKKKNKRATRRYWRRQPKFLNVPDPTIYQIGGVLHCHPEMLAKLEKAIAGAS